jgi:hypothetical protein
MKKTPTLSISLPNAHVVRTTLAERFLDASKARVLTERSDFAVIHRRDVTMEVVLNDNWRAEYRFALQNSQAVLAEMRVYPNEPGMPSGAWSGDILGFRATVPKGGLTGRAAREAATLGSVNVAAQRAIIWTTREHELVRQAERPASGNEHAIAKIARQYGLRRKFEPFEPAGLWGQLGVAQPDRLTTSPGRRSAVLLRYAQAAEVYVQALVEGHAFRHKELRYVEKRLRVSYSKARDYVHKARVEGLLIPSKIKPGRAVGSLTDRARTLLRSHRRKSTK